MRRLKKNATEQPLSPQAPATAPEAASVGEASIAPMNETPANIRLRDGAEPATLGSLGYKGIVLPDSMDAQADGWYEPLARYVVQLYGLQYELIGSGS